MTILGQHGVDEVRHLMRTAEFRIERAGALVNRLPFSNENVKLVKEWDDYVDVRWKNAHDAVLSTLVTLRLDNPGAAESFIPAEKEWNIISKALNKTAGLISPGDLTDLIRRLEAASGQTLDESNHPLPTSYDPDLKAFQAVDNTIKAGEAAAKQASKSLAASIPWWAWPVGAVVLGGVSYTYIRPVLSVLPSRKS